MPETDDQDGKPLTWNPADNRRRRARQKATKARLAQQRQARIEREALILNMRRSGATFHEIAAQLGLSRNYCSQLYDKALQENRATNVNEYRATALDRLERLMQPYYGAALSGSTVIGGRQEVLSQADRVAMGRQALAIIREMNLLMGAHAPQQVDVTGTVMHQVTTDSVLGKLARLRAQMDAAAGEEVVEAEVVSDNGSEPPALTA